MPAKKKAPARTKRKKPTPARKARGGATTIDSSSQKGNSDTTMPSSAAPVVPPEKKPASKPVRIQYPARERRMNPDGRRGRFAEKAPPGTRTKMLKIIYDRKAEMARKKQQALIGKLIMAVMLCASLYYGAQHAMDLAGRGFTSVIEMMDLEGWWSNVATNTPQQRTRRYAPQQKRQNVAPSRTRYQGRTSPKKAVVKRTTYRKRAPAKRVSNKRTYGQTRLYKGKSRSRRR